MPNAKIQLKISNSEKLKIKGWAKLQHENTNKKAGLAILRANKVKFIIKSYICDEDLYKTKKFNSQ